MPVEDDRAGGCRLGVQGVKELAVESRQGWMCGSCYLLQGLVTSVYNAVHQVP
jgi:hypothetical protein